MKFKHLIAGLFLVLSGPIFSQTAPFEINGYGAGHWFDTINVAVNGSFRNAQSAQEQSEIRAEVDALMDSLMASEISGAAKSYASRLAYKIWDKRKDFDRYISTLKDVEAYAPADSASLKFFANYQIGNTYIFNDKFDTAAIYLLNAYKIDEVHDLGGFEGSVQERTALILYKMGEYKQSLSLAKSSLDQATGRLRAAVFNQLGNTYNMLERYEEAAIAYDSAAVKYEAMGVSNWMPLFNSMTAYMEIEGGEDKFLEAYQRVKEETQLLEYDQFYHSIEVAKAEFTMTYWKRPDRYDPEKFGDMILERTPENEKEVRRILGNQIAYTEGEYMKQGEAYKLLERYYALVQPDSISYALKEILAINRAYKKELLVSTAKEAPTEGPLKELILEVGLDRLDETQEIQVAALEQIQTGRKWLIGYAGLLAISLVGLYRALLLRKRRKKIIEDSQLLQERERQLLENMLPEKYHKIIREGGDVKSEQHQEIIVLVADFQGFSAFAQKVPTEELIQYLKEFFDRFESDCAHFGLEKLKTDGDSFIAIGGMNRDYVSPRQALNAALAMQKTTASINSELKRYNMSMSLRIGIDIGTVDSGLVGNTSLVFDMWGEVFRSAKKLEMACPPGHVLMSEKLINAESTGVKWPKYEEVEVQDMNAYSFKS